jgi:RNA polymerase sigma factor (sigma-70 family)
VAGDPAGPAACIDRDLVADAIGDTFVAVWQRPRGFRGGGDIAAWLWGIAIRRLVSRLRARGGVAAVSGHAGAAPAAEDQVLLWVEYGDIGQALARLAPGMRAVIQAVVLDGLSAREAAQLLHVPVSSVKTRLYRARARLRAALAVPGEAPFAWLLPAAGFAAVVLAASTWVGPLRAAIAVSSAWLAVIWLLAARSGSPGAVLQGRAQAGFLALAAASLVIFLVRRRRLRQLRTWR